MRELTWDGLSNARDLGGLPIDGGRAATAAGAVIRSENVHRLTDRGWAQLHKYGVRTVIDLRFAEERADDPPHRAEVEVAAVSLFGVMDQTEGRRVADLVRSAPDGATAIEWMYVDVLATRGAEIALALEKMARAAPGGVLVHCFVGKDRTGIVVALLLRLAGVEQRAIVDDYALSATRVGALVDTWIDEAATHEQRLFRERVSAAPARAMERALAALDQRFGGIDRYLADIGLRPGDIARLRVRILGGSA